MQNTDAERNAQDGNGEFNEGQELIQHMTASFVENGWRCLFLFDSGQRVFVFGQAIVKNVRKPHDIWEIHFGHDYCSIILQHDVLLLCGAMILVFEPE